MHNVENPFLCFHANDYLLFSMCKKLNIFFQVKWENLSSPYACKVLRQGSSVFLKTVFIFTCVSEANLVLHGRCFWIYHFTASWTLIFGVSEVYEKFSPQGLHGVIVALLPIINQFCYYFLYHHVGSAVWSWHIGILELVKPVSFFSIKTLKHVYIF